MKKYKLFLNTIVETFIATFLPVLIGINAVNNSSTIEMGHRMSTLDFEIELDIEIL